MALSMSPAGLLARVKPFASGRCAVARPLHNIARHNVQTKAYVEASTQFAVTQQAIAFALVVGGEALYSKFNVPDSNTGKPEVVPVAAVAGATLLSVVILNSGVDALLTLGLITGLGASGAALAYNVQRTLKAEDPGNTDWPGPKALPATMALISFFALNVFIQGLRAEL